MKFAQNSMSSKEIFDARRSYRYPSSNKIEKPINLWTIQKDFGKLNTFGEPFLPRFSSLEELDKTLCLGEVKTHALKLQETMKILVNTGKTCISTILSDFTFKKSFINFETTLLEANQNTKQLFFEYLRTKKVTCFKDFVFHFDNFCFSICKTANVTPLGLFLNSGTCYSSGLSLNFNLFPHDNDEIKYKRFFESPAFGDYTRLCGEYNFFVNKNAPWNIVYNASSELISENCQENTLFVLFNKFKSFLLESFDEFCAKSVFYTNSMNKFLIKTDKNSVSLDEIAILYTNILSYEFNFVHFIQESFEKQIKWAWQEILNLT